MRRPNPHLGALVPLLATTLGALVLAAACGAPFEKSKARMGELQLARKEARGAWIVLTYRRERPVRTLAGELLSAARDSIHVLTSEGLTALPASGVESAYVTLYEAPSQETGAPVLVLRPPAVWSSLVPHARFPQGLPPDFDRHPIGGR